MQLLIDLLEEQNYEELFAYKATNSWSIWFDSNQDSKKSRYSYLAVNPFLRFRVKDHLITIENKVYTGNPWLKLKSLLQEYNLSLTKINKEDIEISYSSEKTKQAVQNSSLPDFLGGAAGLISYDACKYLEKINNFPLKGDTNFPEIAIGFYDTVLCFDHKTKNVYLLLSSLNMKNYGKRVKEINSELKSKSREFKEDYKRYLNGKLEKDTEKKSAEVISDKKDSNREEFENYKCNFTKDEYIKTIEKAIDYIYCGDVFEVNITQGFNGSLNNLSALDLFLLLREKNKVSFGGFFNLDGKAIASFSPERFIRIKNFIASTEPIKGTIKRDLNPMLDLKNKEKLLASEKDRAENVMIVDLMRNDFSKVCKPDSVEVTKLCTLESFSALHHLVSEIKGELADNYSAIDLIMSCFPGGSITGAPKVRAMEIISELEQTRRGPYCGSLFYLSINGDMDSSILIRSCLIEGENISLSAGGAVVSDSIPLSEYQESILKARSILNDISN